MLDYKKLRRLRRTRDLSQLELSQAVGYRSLSCMWRLENGRMDILLSRLERIANVLGVTVAELLIPESPDPKS